jgi:hypothetical protein
MRKNDNKSSDKMMAMYVFGYPHARLQKKPGAPGGNVISLGLEQFFKPIIQPDKFMGFQ